MLEKSKTMSRRPWLSGSKAVNMLSASKWIPSKYLAMLLGYSG